MKKQFCMALAVIGMLAAAAWFFCQPAVTDKPALQNVARVSQPAPVAAPAPEQPAMAAVPEPPVSEPSAPVPTVPAAKPHKKSGAVKTAKTKPPIQDPDARAALSFVGTDPDAEAYWASAINDPTLPAEERKDLIEDLNQDGLSNPDHPGPDDFPLIVNRLQLIDEMSPDAMDPVNARAFQDARKDLVAMLNGEPVQ
jgi:hypothetical protein